MFGSKIWQVAEIQSHVLGSICWVQQATWRRNISLDGRCRHEMIESFQNQQKETNKVIKVIKVLWVHPLQYARSVTQDHYAFGTVTFTFQVSPKPWTRGAESIRPNAVSPPPVISQMGRWVGKRAPKVSVCVWSSCCPKIQKKGWECSETTHLKISGKQHFDSPKNFIPLQASFCGRSLKRWAKTKRFLLPFFCSSKDFVGFFVVVVGK